VLYNQGCQYFCIANSELGRVWKIAIATIFIVLSLNFSGSTEESLGNPRIAYRLVEICTRNLFRCTNFQYGDDEGA